MIALVLQLVLAVPACNAADSKKEPTYCACVNNARADYQACLEGKLVDCEITDKVSSNPHVMTCKTRAQSECYKRKDRALYGCSNFKGKK